MMNNFNPLGRMDWGPMQRKTQSRPWIRILGLILLTLPLAVLPVWPQSSTEAEITFYDQEGNVLPRVNDTEETLTPPDREDFYGPHSYLPGEVIIKFHHTLNQSAKYLLETGQSFSSALDDGSTLIDQINQDVGLTAVKTLFFPRYGISTAEASAQYQNLIQQSATQFPISSTGSSWPISGTGPDIPDMINIYVFRFNAENNPEEVCARYLQDSNVEYCHPNHRMQLVALPNDTHVDTDPRDGEWDTGSMGLSETLVNLWGLKFMDVETAWPTTQGEGIVVAVVDSGVDYHHPEIRDNIWINPDVIDDADADGDVDFDDALAAVDANANDRIDPEEIIDQMIGWDFLECEVMGAEGCLVPHVPDNNPMDENGHGTHVAGTIAAVMDNTTGIAGVAPRAKIMPLKVFSAEGASSGDETAQALEYAARHGADVINNSWGCRIACPSDPTNERAVRLAHSRGSVVVMAAGNSSSDVALYSPQNMTNPKPIVVGASTPDEGIAAFSNFGALVDIVAPGGGGDNLLPAFEPKRNILSLRAQGTGEPWLTVGLSGGEYHLLVHRDVQSNQQTGFNHITFDVTVPADQANLGDFINLYTVGAPNDQPVLLPTTTLGLTQFTGGYSLGDGSLPPGQYEFRYFQEGTLTDVARSNTLTLIDGPMNESRPVLAFSAKPPVISPGETSTLTWTGTVSEGTVCTTSGGSWDLGPIPLEGTHEVSPVETAHYFLSCDGPDGRITRMATVWIGAKYLREAGTSMSSPHAAGLAALIVSHRNATHPADPFTHDQVRQVMRTSADDILTPGFDILSTNGRINAAKALAVESVLNVHITDPQPNTLFKIDDHEVTITGAVEGEDFESYSLAYGFGIFPAEWIPIGDPVLTPVETGGTLGTWSLDGIGTGTYLVRVVAKNSTGDKFQDVVAVHVERETINQIPFTRRQFNARISGDRVVYEIGIFDNDIVVYDFQTGQKQQLTADAEITHILPEISGDNIAWLVRYAADWGIAYHNLATDESGFLSNGVRVEEDAPHISGDWVVWDEDPDDGVRGNFNIFAYNIAVHKKMPVTDLPESRQVDANVFGDKVVWIDSRNGNKDIYLYDLETETEEQLTSHPRTQDYPVIEDNLVVWNDYRNGLADIYLYDLSTGAEHALATHPGHQAFADISGHRVSWLDHRDGIGGDVVVYDLNTDTELHITANPTTLKTVPGIDGDRIVWSEGFRNEQTMAVYWADLLSLNPIGSQNVAVGEPLQFVLHADDPHPDGGEVIFSADPLPAGSSWNPESGEFQWTPQAGQEGVYRVTFMAVNAINMSDVETVTIAVGRSAPVFNPIADQTVTEDEPLQFTVSATDQDGGPLQYGVEILPREAEFSGQTFSWTPAADQSGDYRVTFTATDADGLTDTLTVNIKVLNGVLALLEHGASPNPFSPNGDGISDTTTITARYSQPAQWEIWLYNFDDYREVHGTGDTVHFVWDGRNEEGDMYDLTRTLKYKIRAYEIDDPDPDTGNPNFVDANGIIKVSTEAPFIRGDANDDGMVNSADAVFNLKYIFLAGAAPECFDAADANDDGAVDVGDPVYILFYKFSGGPSPSEPFPAPGHDPTVDTLTCQ